MTSKTSLSRSVTAAALVGAAVLALGLTQGASASTSLPGTGTSTVAPSCATTKTPSPLGY